MIMLTPGPPILLFLLYLGSSHGATYNCPAFVRKGPATSVWDLSPSQVDVVLAVGDSITAAFGAAGRRGGLREFRGWSWSMGGDENVTTLPNFLRHFSPELSGYSLGEREVSLCWGGICRDIHRPENDVMNAALSGAMIRNVVKEELPYLMDQMKGSTLDITRTWKVLTLLVGANDVCTACREDQDPNTDEWEASLRTILDTIRDRVPNVLVNVMELFNVSKIYDATENVPYCRGVHSLAFLECDCAFGPEAARFRERMDVLATLYNQKTREVVAEYMREKNDTFAIALHVFTHDMDVSTMPLDMISDLDCFHPSAKSQALSATALWNSMLTPPDMRETNMDLNLKPICPDQESVFYPGLPTWIMPSSPPLEPWSSSS